MVETTDVMVVITRDAKNIGDFRLGRTSFISHSGSLMRAEIS